MTKFIYQIIGGLAVLPLFCNCGYWNHYLFYNVCIYVNIKLKYLLSSLYHIYIVVNFVTKYWVFSIREKNSVSASAAIDDGNVNTEYQILNGESMESEADS